MPGPTAWQQQLFAYSSGSVTAVTTAETVLCTLTPINSRSPGTPINLNAWTIFQSGASTTALTLRIRGDSLTGSVIGGAAVASVAVATIPNASYDIAVVDLPAGEVAGKSYVLTAQQTAATGNGTAVLACLFATY